MAFVSFVSVEMIFQILRRSEQTEQYVPCLSAEKKKYERGLSAFSALSKSDNDYHDAPAFLFGDSRLSAARQPHMFLWCRYRAASAMGLQAAISPFVNPRFARLFLRYAYRSGTISALLLLACVGRQGEVKH